MQVEQIDEFCGFSFRMIYQLDQLFPFYSLPFLKKEKKNILISIGAINLSNNVKPISIASLKKKVGIL